MKKHIKHILSRKTEIIIGVLAVCFFFGSVSLLWVASLKLPDLGSFESRKISQSTKIYDRTGSILLYDINQGTRRTVLKSADISRNIKNASVAIEDEEFYQHRGIKFTSIIRAILANLTSGGYSQGGSTITQQVIKNSLLTTEKSVSRKLKEWILSLKLEREMGKDEILTLYLNEAPFGGNIYGVEEAAKNFFGKHASEVTLGEAAYLAALPNAPSYYSPYGGNRSALEKRKNLVLERMLKNAFITKEEYDSAMAEKINFNPVDGFGIKAPHFVMYIKGELEKRFGTDVMESSGLKVITTLDYDLEKKAEEIVAKYAEENEKNFNATNAAMTAIDPKTGEILVMVGSRNYFDQKIDGNFNIITAKRQPGSSIKPFVYATAFEKGYTPETVLFDVKTEFSSECNPDGTPKKDGDEKACYMPENYDEKYRGPITLRSALAQSINIPAIKVLYLAGIKNVINLANDMGIESLNDPNRYGLTLVLGGGEVSPLELTGGYAVFANDGIRIPPHGIIKIENGDGQTVYSDTSEPKQVLDSQIARKITDVLSDNEARSPSYGYNSPLFFPGYDVAAKTGTTNDYKDAWIMGYSPRIAVGAWVGNNDNTPMEKKVARFIVAPMWNAFMKEFLSRSPVERFKKPDEETTTNLKPVLRGIWKGGESYFIDSRTGNPATDETPENYVEEKIKPEIHTILYWLDKNNPLGPRPINPQNDSQFELWETPIRKWVSENGISEAEVVQKNVESVNIPQVINTQPMRISIISPRQQTPYLYKDKINVEIAVTGGVAPTRIEFYINGQFIGSSISQPYSISFLPKELSMIQKYNNVRAVAYGPKGEKVEASISFVIDF